MNDNIVIDDAPLLHHHQNNNNYHDRQQQQQYQHTPSSLNHKHQNQNKDENMNGNDIPYDNIPPTPTTLKQYQHRRQQAQQQQQQTQKRKRQPYRHSTTNSYSNYDTPPEYNHRANNRHPSSAPIMTRTKRFIQASTNLLYGGLNSATGTRRGDYYEGFENGGGGEGGGMNGMGVAMIIIFLFQFRGIIISTLRQSVHRFTYLLERNSDEYGGVFIFFLDIYDYIRSYMYWGWDSLVRLRFILSSNASPNNSAAVPNNGRGGRGQKSMRHLRPEAHNQRGGVGGVVGGMDRNSPMLPDLEDVPEFEEEGDGHDRKRQHFYSKERRKSRWDDEIEPAFLRDEDYPTDWLIFHPCYGVIPKKRLDQLKNKEKGNDGGVVLMEMPLHHEEKVDKMDQNGDD